jgi:hypothetical protein
LDRLRLRVSWNVVYECPVYQSKRQAD